MDRTLGILFTAFFALCPFLLLGQLTTITGTLRNPDGTLSNGTVNITLNGSMIASGGIPVYGRVGEPINVINGVFSVTIYANNTGTPSTTSYRFDYDLRTPNGVASPRLAQTCVVTYSASSVTIQSVCSDSSPPIATSSVPVSRLTGGSAKGDIIAYTGSAWQAHTGEITGCYFVRDDVEADGVNCIAASPTSGIGDPGSNGILSRTAINTTTARTLTGTSNEVDIANGTGVSGNPTFSLSASLILSGKQLEIPNSTSLTSTDCDDPTEAGRIFVNTAASSGQQFYVCEGAAGWQLQGASGTGDITAVTAGTGLSGGGTVGPVTLNVDSSEAGFLTAGALTCGASTAGKAQIHTTALQYCDNAATPTLRYAAYGDSTGLATAGDSATAFFSAGALEKARQHASTTYIDAANTYSTGAQDFGAATSLEVPNGASPTTSTFGQIAGDNNAWAASRGAPQWYDGTANVYLVGALASDTPLNGQVPRWNTGGTITWEFAAGDVTGAGSSTDEAIVRFDGTGGALLQNSVILISDTGVFTFPDGIRQTFNPNGTAAGLNVGSQAGDPGTPSNGDLWYDSSANELTARINGANVVLGQGFDATAIDDLTWSDGVPVTITHTYSVVGTNPTLAATAGKFIITGDLEVTGTVSTTGSASPMIITEIAAPGAASTSGTHHFYIDSTSSLLSSHENGGVAKAYVATTASDIGSNGQIPMYNTGGAITWESVGAIVTGLTPSRCLTTDASGFITVAAGACGTSSADVGGGTNLTTVDRVVVVSAAATVTQTSFTYQQVSRCATYTVGEASLTDADTSEDETLFTLPAGGRVTGVAIKHSTAFTGGGLSAMTVSVGVSGTVTAYSISAFDIFQAVANTTMLLADNFNSTTNASQTVIAQFNSTGANVSAATAGSVDLEVCYVEP